ncbi:hypothetical protein BJ944DRAFT_246707 [Cunninghamella echinulata]|nr:hypothetical protein BJ944DRAFT_246707 [Cunninghamella echinulata]
MIVLNYYDVDLHDYDLKTLENGEWLNDKIVEFYMEYMERTTVHNDILLLRPAMVHLLTYMPGDPKDLQSVLPPQFENRRVIFIPINDGIADKAYSGTHWSLLVFFRSSKTFFYYDSLNTSNIRPAKYTAKRMIPLLGLDVEPEFKVIPSPQQEGTSDCGLMVLSLMDLLIRRMISNTLTDENGQDILTTKELDSMKSPHNIRKDMNVLIKKMLVEKNK